MGGHRRLNERLALSAHPLAPHVALDRELPRGVVEFLGHVFADALQRAATGAHGLGRFVAHFAPGQIRWQGLALGLLRLRVACLVAQRFEFLGQGESEGPAQRQRPRVRKRGGIRLGHREWIDEHVDRARQALAERNERELQREVSR